MTISAVFALEITTSLVLLGLAGWWWAWPSLKSMRAADALSLLLIIHCFRTLGVSLMVPAAGIDIPARAAQEIGFGDLAAASLAFISILALRYRPALSRPLIWAFSVVGMVDLVNAQIVGVQCSTRARLWLVHRDPLRTVALGDPRVDRGVVS